MATKTLRMKFIQHGSQEATFFSEDYDNGEWCPKLCAAKVREYTDLPVEREFDLVMTTKRPKGSNFHTLKYSRAQWGSNHYLANVGPRRPDFYHGFTSMIFGEFNKRTVYAWVEA